MHIDASNSLSRRGARNIIHYGVRLPIAGAGRCVGTLMPVLEMVRDTSHIQNMHVLTDGPVKPYNQRGN